MDVLHLFEENTVEQVRGIERRTRGEIERKKEELRFLVGERYRELIVAADAIKAMQHSVQRIHDSLSELNSRFSGLRASGRLEFDASGGADCPAARLRQRRCQLGAQIQLLLDIPELMYSNLESHSCLTAAQLFCIASHIHTHLELSGELQECGIRAEPLLQWQAVAPLKKATVAKCHELLAQPITFKASSLSDKSLSFAEHLVALMLLDSLDVDAVVQEFFTLRSQSVELTFKDLESDTSKAQFLFVASNLLSSVEICHTLFSASSQFESGLLLRLLQEKLQLSARQIVSGLGGSRVPLRHLPSHVLDCRPVQALADLTLAVTALTAAADHWLAGMQKFLRYQLMESLQFVTDLGSLYSIRCALLNQFKEVETSTDWASCCAAVFQRKVDLWAEVFHPVFHDKLTSVCEATLSDCYNSWSSEADKLLQDIRSEVQEGGTQHEFALAAFLWTEAPKESIANRLQLRTPRLQSICDACDAALRSLLAGVDRVVNDEAAGDAGQLVSMARAQLDDFGRRCAERLRLRLPQLDSEHQLLAAHRLAAATASVLAALGTAGGRWRRQLAQVDACLRAASCEAADAWLDCLAARHAKKFEAALLDSLGSRRAFLQHCARWLPAGEQQQQLCPSTASQPVHQLLLGLCRDLAAGGGHSLLRPSMERLLRAVSDAALASVDRCLDAVAERLLPNQRAQLLLDTRFLFAVLSRRTESPANAAFNEALEALVAKIEAGMDPFDLEAIGQQLAAGAAAHARACSLLYAAIATVDRLSAFASRAPAAPGAAAQPDGHSVLASVPAVPRFGLLPVSYRPADVAGQAPVQQQQQQQQLKSVQTVPANLSSVRESPSFYNKMNSILFKS